MEVVKMKRYQKSENFISRGLVRGKNVSSSYVSSAQILVERLEGRQLMSGFAAHTGSAFYEAVSKGELSATASLQVNNSSTVATSAIVVGSSTGAINSANMNEITGWAYDPSNPTATVHVEFDITGGPTTPQTIVANENDPTLTPVIGSANHGFAYATPMLTAGTHSVGVYAIYSDNSKALIGSTSVKSQNSLFDEHYYLQENPDVAAAVADGRFATGYDHYIQYGQFEGRSPSPFWNESWYLQQNSDVAAAVKDKIVTSGFMHYYLYGQYENRPGLLYFDTNYYLSNNPDVANAVANKTDTSAFQQFADFGQYQGTSPIAYFSSAIYDADNPDILPFVTGEPISSDYEHFVEYGQFEGRVASTLYNEATYLADNGDVAAAVAAGEFKDGFIHWLEYGQYEGRTAVQGNNPTQPPVVTPTVTIQTVPVGNAGNAPDTNGLGSVGYTYNIGKYDVTSAQYCAFLNAVAAADTFALYSPAMAGTTDGNPGIVQSGSPGSYAYTVIDGRGDHPVTDVSFWNATRFANWLNNGEPTGPEGAGTTETGAYDVLATSMDAALANNPPNKYTVTSDQQDDNMVIRSANAKWAVTSENEWYKAAYYSPTLNSGAGGYYLSPGQAVPTTNQNVNTDSNDTTPVGSFPDYVSYYGTLDQGGNVYQWNETITNGWNVRGERGGAFDNGGDWGRADSTESTYQQPFISEDNTGFRVVELS
jgi:formylglycine-generating enzyme required for sulfatase activity